MRVVIVTRWYPTASFPVSGVFVRRDAELLAAEHDVRVVHLAAPSTLSQQDAAADAQSTVPVTRLPMNPSSLGDLRRVWRPLKEHLREADVLHTQAFATLQPFAGRRVQLPWVHTEHWSGIGDTTSLTPRGRAVLRLTGRLLRRPDIVTAVSDHLAARVQAFRPGPVIVVPPAVAPVTLVAPPGDSATIRLVSVGGLVPGKDPFLALDIVRELHRREVGAELTWVGDGPLRAALESAAGPGDRLTLLGAQDDAGVARSLDSADVFLLPTRGETLCLSAVEAITHGRPVVIGSNGGQREFVSAANGRLVRPRTPASYADAILDVWALRSTRDPAAIAASIGDRFQPEVVRAAYNEAYERAAAVYR